MDVMGFAISLHGLLQLAYVLAAWFLISVPIGILVGRFLALKPPALTERDALSREASGVRHGPPLSRSVRSGDWNS